MDLLHVPSLLEKGFKRMEFGRNLFIHRSKFKFVVTQISVNLELLLIPFNFSKDVKFESEMSMV